MHGLVHQADGQGQAPRRKPLRWPQQAHVACATGELVDNPAMHHSVEQEALAYAMLPLPCDRLGTGEETIYFTTDCALIHGYRLHPWIASCPGNGPGIRLHDAQRAMGPEAGHENGEPTQSLRPPT